MLVIKGISKYANNQKRNSIEKNVSTNIVSDSKFNNLETDIDMNIKKTSAKKCKKEYEIKKPDHEIGHHKKK